jgi:hypothetical protein
MPPHDTSLLGEIIREIEELKIRVNDLERINGDRIDDEKTKQFYEDKLGL